VRVAVVGTGGVARRHLGVLRSMHDVELVGHVSADPSRAEAQAAQWGGRAFTTADELLERERPDAVWVCVTPDRHGPLEHALIDANVPFFVEKPLSVDLEPAETIAARLAATGVLAAVGYKFRALDTLDRVRELLDDRPPRMVLGAWHDAMPSPPWWRQAARSGGQIVEQATHLIDLARFLVGEGSVESAVGARWRRPDAPDSDVPDVSGALLRFQTTDGDVPGVFSATCLLEGREAIHLQLVCEGRVLTLSDRALTIDTGQHRSEIATSSDPFEVEDRLFLDAVRHRDASRVLSSYVDALKTHRLCCAIRDAMASPRGPAAIDGQGRAGDHLRGG
jgi:myo-inositol 2-dehydrogenase/D-chiro-inositol 1-dehydrogenase